MSPATLNRIWARLILLSLQRAGVTEICIAPGSRSTPLTLEAEKLQGEFPSLRLHTHFDERGLGFLALGLAKASGKPVAVIVTSGTAVANLLPAVAESRLTREKLILLTADRPPELIQCGANQAISQHGIFGDHADVAAMLPAPTERISPAWLLSTIAEGLHHQAEQGGSYHINCPFPEPLYGAMDDASAYLAPVNGWLHNDAPYLTFTSCTQDISPLLAEWQTLQHQKGVLVVGSVSATARLAIEKLALRLQWPMLCDPQAGAGSEFAHFDLWLQNADSKATLEQAQVILQFGSRLVSKRLSQYLNAFQGRYWLVDAHPGRLDPYHLAGTRVNACAEQFVSQVIQRTDSSRSARWADALKEAARACRSLVAAKEELSELTLAREFGHWLGQGSDIFLGNSMAIRLLDMAASLPERAVFANRGASGIDGLIATAAGVQRARQRPMVMLMGDTSALYDLNSLALLTQCPAPFVLVIINNDGGGIFDMLPVPDVSKDTFYRMPHGLSFAHAAAMFGLNYGQPTTLEEAKRQVLDGQSSTGCTLIEISVPAGECGQQLKALFNDIANASLL